MTEEETNAIFRMSEEENCLVDDISKRCAVSSSEKKSVGVNAVDHLI